MGVSKPLITIVYGKDNPVWSKRIIASDNNSVLRCFLSIQAPIVNRLAATRWNCCKM